MFLLMITHAMLQSYMFDFGREQGIANISVFYLVLAVSLAVTRPMCGIFTDKFGIEKVMFPGLMCFAAAMFLIGSSSMLWMALIGAVLAALGIGASQPSLQAMCMQSETPIKRGVASNTIYIGIDLGLFLGPIIGAFIRDQTDLAVMYRASAMPVVLAMVSFALILPIHRRRIRFLDGQG